MLFYDCFISFFFFFNDTATTEIYTLSLHDALPILRTFPIVLLFASLLQSQEPKETKNPETVRFRDFFQIIQDVAKERSEEHTSELQSHSDLVCRLLLEKKKDEDPTAEHAQEQQHVQ